MKLRKITSLTMLVSFVFLVLTSIILYIEPQGRVAYWSDWRLWGLSKTQWGDLHLNLGTLFLLAGIFHLVYNWKAITAYLKDKARQLHIFTPNFNLALAVTLLVVTGTLLNIPPMSTLVSIGNSITDRANLKYGEPPYGHAELSSLKMFARRTDLDLNKARMLLEKAGIRFKDDQQSILEIAQANGMTPQALNRIMKPASTEFVETTTFPDSPPAGFGQQTLTKICAAYSLDPKRLLGLMAERGIKANPEETIKEAAQKNGKNPMAIFEMIHEAANGQAR